MIPLSTQLTRPITTAAPSAVRNPSTANPLDQPAGQEQHECIDHDQPQPERDDRDRQREQIDHWADEEVDHAQHEAGQQQVGQAAVPDAVEDQPPRPRSRPRSPPSLRSGVRARTTKPIPRPQPPAPPRARGWAAWPSRRSGRRRRAPRRSGVPCRFGSSLGADGSWAIGQRGWNRQPVGRRIGLGGSPTTAAASEVRPGTSRGTARSRPCVYGCRGFVNSSAVGAVSTIRPRYITATRSQTWRTTAMLCAMNSIVSPSCSPQVLEQVEHRRLHRDVERRHRLVGDQHLRLERERAGDARRAGAGRPRTGAGARRARRGARPTSSSSSRQRASTAPGGTIRWTRSSSPSAWRTVMRGFSDEYGILEHHLDPPPLRSLALGAPSGAPANGPRRPSARRGRRCSGPSVDLPQPDSPTRPSASPGAISRSTPSTARSTSAAGASARRLATTRQREVHLRGRAPRAAAQPPAITGSRCTSAAQRVGVDARGARGRRASAAAGTRRPCSRAARTGSAGGSGSPAAARRGRAARPGSTQRRRARRRGRAPSAAGRACTDGAARGTPSSIGAGLDDLRRRT